MQIKMHIDFHWRIFSVPVSYYDVDYVNIVYEIHSTDTDWSTVQTSLDDDVRLSSSSDGREPNISFLQESFPLALDSVEKLSNLDFEVLTRGLGASSWFPTLNTVFEQSLLIT